MDLPKIYFEDFRAAIVLTLKYIYVLSANKHLIIKK